MRFACAIIGASLLGVAAAASAAPGDADAPFFIHPATVSQPIPLTAHERQNLDMVLRWWREVVEARHTELAEQYQAEDYIQHNPNIPTGRAAFIRAFAAQGPPINPIPTELSHPPVVMGAKGDFVWLVFEYALKDPRAPASTQTYFFNGFDIVRIQNGKIQEHWDSSEKFSGSPAFVPSTAPAPSVWSAGALSATERRNVRLATEEFKDMMQYGHLELADRLIDPEYLEHNPNLEPGREALKEFLEQGMAAGPEPIRPEWMLAPKLTLAQGPYVLLMWYVSRKDPDDPSKTYTKN